MIRGIRLEQETKITNKALMATGNSPIDFIFVQARDGLRDSQHWSWNKSQVKELVGKNGVLLSCPYTALAYSPASPSGADQVGDLYGMAMTAGEYQFHLPVGILLTHQLYTEGNYYPVADKAGYLTKAVDAVNAAKSLQGRNPIIMTTPGFMAAFTSIPKEILDCPLYIAHWGASFPMLSKWGRYTFWESAKNDAWGGVNGSVFVAEFPDDRSVLKKWYGDETTVFKGGYPSTTPDPIPTCQPGEHWDEILKVCVKDDSPECPEGEHWDDTLKLCVKDAVPSQPIPGDIAETLQAIYTDVNQIKLMIESFRSLLK